MNGQGNRADLQAPFGFDADSHAKLGRDQTKSGKIKANQGSTFGFTTGTPHLTLKEKFGLFVDFEFLTKMGHKLIDSRWFEKNPPTESG